MRRRARPCALIRAHALQCAPMRLLVQPLSANIRKHTCSSSCTEAARGSPSATRAIIVINTIFVFEVNTSTYEIQAILFKNRKYYMRNF